MKEIIRKVIICVVALVVVIGAAAFALKGDSTDTNTTTTTSASASAGESDSEGNKTTTEKADAQVNAGVTADANDAGNDNGGSQEQTTGNNVQTPDASQPTQQGVTDSGNSGEQNPQGDVQSQTTTQVQQQGAVTPENTTATLNPGQPQQVYKIDAYQNIFKSGRFLMKVNDPDLGPVVMGMSGNKMFVEASMEELTLKMLYDGDTPDKDNPESGTWYIVIDKIKKYSPMPADMLGEMNMADLTKNFGQSDEINTYTTSVETVNGEQLYVESSIDQNGNTTKYYFRGDELIRSDSVSPSGEVSTTEFEDISPDVDESLFVVPDGYAKWDISWLINMMG